MTLADSLVQTFQPFVELSQFQSRYFSDILAVEQEVKRLLLQSLAFAFGTFTGSAELLSPSLSRNTNFSILHLLNVFDQTVEFRIDIIRGFRLTGTNSDAFRTALQDFVYRFFRNLAKWCVSRTSIRFEHSFHLPEYHSLLCFAKRSETSVAKRKGRVGNDLVSVDDMNEAKALATRASALRTVEREVVRSWVVIGDTCCGAHQVLAVMAHFVCVHIADKHFAFALLHGNGDTLNESLIVSLLHLKAVNHNLDAMIAIAVELHARQEFLHFAVHASIEISFATDVLEEFLVVSLAVLDERSQQDDAFPQVFIQEQVNNLLFRIAHHLLASNVGIGFGSPCVKQPEEVIYLGSCADGTSGVLVGGLLLDADDGTQPCNLIDIGSFHSAQEVASISTERLDIAALTFCINGVESKRRLATTAEASKYSKAVTRNLNVHVLQIMDASTLHANLLFTRHLWCLRFRHCCNL